MNAEPLFSSQVESFSFPHTGGKPGHEFTVALFTDGAHGHSFGSPLILSYSRTPILRYSQAPILSYSHTLILSYSHTLILSYSHTFILSYFHTLILSYRRRFSLLATLSYMHRFSLLPELQLSPTRLLSVSWPHELVVERIANGVGCAASACSGSIIQPRPRRTRAERPPGEHGDGQRTRRPPRASSHSVNQPGARGVQ